MDEISLSFFLFLFRGLALPGVANGVVLAASAGGRGLIRQGSQWGSVEVLDRNPLTVIGPNSNAGW